MKNEQQQQARNLFFETSLTQAQIADFVGISKKTMSLWANEGKWRRLRQLATETPIVMIDEMYGEIHRINQLIKSREQGNQFATPQEADTRRKILSSIHSLKEYQSPGNHAEVLANFMQYVMDGNDNRDDAKLIAKYAENYLTGEKRMDDGDAIAPYGLPQVTVEQDDEYLQRARKTHQEQAIIRWRALVEKIQNTPPSANEAA